jgi:hypothetical protein
LVVSPLPKTKKSCTALRRNLTFLMTKE